MAEPRTEAQAEAGSLTVVMGGQPYELPVLTIRKSAEWKVQVAHAIAGLRTPEDDVDDDDGEVMMTELLTQGSEAKVQTLVAYDHANVLGGRDRIEDSMSERELATAVEVLMEAEYPFDKEASRSVVGAYGLPLKVLGLASQALTEALSRQANSVSGALVNGVTPSPASAKNGRPNNSPSAGPTGVSASAVPSSPGS